MKRKFWTFSLCAGLCVAFTQPLFGQCGSAKKSSGDCSAKTASYDGKAKGECGGDKYSGTTASKGDCSKKSSCGDQQVAQRSGPDIVETAVAAGSFTTLAKALEAAGMVETLKGAGPFTVFAPTDEAFKRLPAGALDGLLNNPGKLRAVLKYHVVAGEVSSKDVSKMRSASTVLGQDVKVASFLDIRINDAKVTQRDIQASNGVIHVIDQVLMPKDDLIDVAEKAGNFKTLVAAIRAAGLEDTARSGGPYTVFAPTDEAFSKLPAGTVDALLQDQPRLRSVLKYHVVAEHLSGQEIAKMHSAHTLLGQSLELHTASPTRVNGVATVTAKDIHAANGVIHVVDAVLIPKADIVCTARDAGQFNTLLTAIRAAGLEDKLRGAGPYTVFAPTDEAFAALPAGTVDALLKDKEKLAAILAYHVVKGELSAEKVMSHKDATTLNGKPIHFSATDGARVNDARIVKTDISTGNGIIHVIDKVLIPQ